MTVVLQLMIEMNRLEVSKKCQETLKEHQKDNISKRIYKAYKAIKGRMVKLGDQKQSLPPRNKVWVRKESIPMTKGLQEKNEAVR